MGVLEHTWSALNPHAYATEECMLELADDGKIEYADHEPRDASAQDVRTVYAA